MNPHLIDTLSWAMSDVYAAVVDDILVNIAHHFQFITDGTEIPGAFQYQVRKLAEMGQVRQETVRIIMDKLGSADEALKGLLIRSIENALKDSEPALRNAAKKGFLSMTPPQMSPNQMQAFRTYYQQSADKLNLVNTVMLESTQTAYTGLVADITNRIERTQKILNTATGEIVTGVNSFNKILHDSVRKMVDNGLTGFIDHGGHHWSPEAYVAMDMRTTMTNTGRTAVWEQAESVGCELYQVSSHNGARPLCYPWQGKVVSRNGWRGETEDGDGNKVTVHSEDEIESFRYGGGLFGVNCGHYPIPFIPGFSKIRPPQQTEEENAKEYAESQQQRALERKLREEKRELAVMKAQGATDEEIRAQKQRVADARDNLDAFCDKTGRARQRYRETTPINATFPDGYQQTRFGSRPPTPNIPVSPVAPPTPPPEPARPKSEIVKRLDNYPGLDSLKVNKYTTQPTEQEIIKKLAGADKTKGSCASVALAYCGNKAGYDVTDFRGGESQYFFSSIGNDKLILDLEGVQGKLVRNASDFTNAHQLMQDMEEGKEYFFTAGKHAAIVRRNASGYEYLEMQSGYRQNTWYTLNDSELKRRFGCQKSHTTYGMSFQCSDMMFEVSSVQGNRDFAEMLEYINTETSAQRKGMGGGEK